MPLRKTSTSARQGSRLCFSSAAPDFNPVHEAPSAGLEPATDGLEIRCSIQLSYEGKLAFFLDVLAMFSELASLAKKPFDTRSDTR
jgi:hypothetical protein